MPARQAMPTRGSPSCRWRSPTRCLWTSQPAGRASRLLEERSEGNEPERRVDEGEDAEEADPRPALGGRAGERRLERPRGPDEHRRHHWEQEQGEQGLPNSEPGGEDAVEGTGGRETGGRGDDRQRQQSGAVEPAPVESASYRTTTPISSSTSSASSSTAMAPAFPRKIPAGSRADEAQCIAIAVGRLDREAALDGEERAEQDRDPEQSRGRAGEDAAVGIEGEGEEDQHEHRERRDLVRGDARPRCSIRRSLPAMSAASRNTDRLRLRRPSGAGRLGTAWSRPPTSVTVRPASGSARSSSCDAIRTVAPAAAARRTRSSTRSRPAGVEARVGLVEQPELRAAGDEDREGGAPALPGR